MIRSKPSTDAYREAWERVFGKKADEPKAESETTKPAAPFGGLPTSWFVGGEEIK